MWVTGIIVEVSRKILDSIGMESNHHPFQEDFLISSSQTPQLTNSHITDHIISFDPKIGDISWINFLSF